MPKQKTAKPVDNVYVPRTVLPFDGYMWMRFQYRHEGEHPTRWPKVLEYDGKMYEWRSYDSDNMFINYKEIKGKVARPGKTYPKDVGFTVQPGESRESIMGGGL